MIPMAHHSSGMASSSAVGVKPLLLASASPRRHALLSRSGVPHRVEVSAVEEISEHHGAPEDLCAWNALQKAKAVAARQPPGILVLGADTIVVLDERVMGKPVDSNDAVRMLEALSGRTHQVITAFCLVESPSLVCVERRVVTDVWFRHLEKDTIENYIATGEPFDKAGAYGIQDRGAALVERISGSYTNVVGLPLAEVLEALEECGGPRAFVVEAV